MVYILGDKFIKKIDDKVVNSLRYRRRRFVYTTVRRGKQKASYGHQHQPGLWNFAPKTRSGKSTTRNYKKRDCPFLEMRRRALSNFRSSPLDWHRWLAPSIYHPWKETQMEVHTKYTPATRFQPQITLSSPYRERKNISN